MTDEISCSWLKLEKEVTLQGRVNWSGSFISLFSDFANVIDIEKSYLKFNFKDYESVRRFNSQFLKYRERKVISLEKPTG
jgi:hypothetical protein